MQIFGPTIVQNWFWWVLNFWPKIGIFLDPIGLNLGPNMPDNCAADQLIGSVGLGTRAVSRKTPIYFIVNIYAPKNVKKFTQIFLFMAPY